MSIPTPEHYLPLLYVVALQRVDDALQFLVDGIELGSIGMLSIALEAT
jgi:4,5-DOPA dioxygenase extradiol